MVEKAYDFNLLVSCSWSAYGKAKKEIVHVLERLGDENPLVKHTFAKGIVGVRTWLDSREVTRRLQILFDEGSLVFQHTLKWVPVDLWTHSDMDSMKSVVAELKSKIHADETWRMTLEKRRYTRHHKFEIIKELADLIDEKVNLSAPDKILRVDIIGKYAGISILSPKDVFSVTKTYSTVS
jgi:tRNA(Ser,Leu) C12 N-acetylase TAN1